MVVSIPGVGVTITDLTNANETFNNLTVNGALTGATASFSSTVSASNIQGSNTGDVTLAGQNYLAIAGQVVSAGKITNSHMANMNAVTMKANATTSALAPSDVSFSTFLDAAVSGAQGDVIYRGAATWTRLAASTSGLALITSNTSANPLWGNPTGTLIGVNVFTAVSSQYTPTAGMATAIGWIQAAGGGGGGVAGTIAQGAAGGGGGGGSFAMVRWTAAQIGASQAVIINIGGSGGAAGKNDGAAGGDTYVGALVSCAGGLGGIGASAAAVNQAVLGGASTVTPNIGTGTQMFRTLGQPGSPGISFVTLGVNAAGGSGFLGRGAGTTRILGTSDGVGANGHNPGGGAAGAITSNATGYAGGNGGAGIVIIYDYA